MDTTRIIHHPANDEARMTNDRMTTPSSFVIRHSTFRHSSAFTLVELLVVITIIGILAALITVAAVGALRTARQAEIKAEVDQLATAMEDYKNKTTAYPPNCQTDDTTVGGPEPAATPLDEATVLNDLKRHLKQAFPRHQESDNLIRAIAGLPAVGSDASRYPRALAGGMSAGEALVFWLGGFSSDPKYPISGEGGPSYDITGVTANERGNRDPIETRKWVFPFDVGRLGPRNDSGYFDGVDNRFVEYTDPRGVLRRINFWQYLPRRSEQPYLYFDTSRNPPTAAFDPPAATVASGNMALHVHAFKKRPESAGFPAPIDYLDSQKFQIIHCGIDGAWGEEDFERMSMHAMNSTNTDDYLTFPEGPFIGDIADTVVNFTTAVRIEDAQSQ